MTPIEVANLKKYHGDIKAVDGVSFSVAVVAAIPLAAFIAAVRFFKWRED
jgi:hypothetical protein